LSYRPRRTLPLKATRNGAATPYNAAGDPAMPRFLLLSCPAKAGHPVRRSFSNELLTSVFTESPAGACHRAARCADPVARDDDRCRATTVPEGFGL